MFNEVVYSVGEYLMFRETNKTQILGQLTAIVPQS